MGLTISEVVKGDKISFINNRGQLIEAKCTGVTHKDLIHFMYYKGDCPMAGMIGRDYVTKLD